MHVNRRQYARLVILSMMTCVLLLAGGCSTVKRPLQHIPKVAPKPRPYKDIQVALVLGAGGSRGLAHLGVIEVLEKEGIPIDLIVGSSAGSLIGALYADKPNALLIKEKVIKLKKEDLLDPVLMSFLLAPIRLTCPVQGNAIEQYLVKQLKSRCFEDLKIPLIAVATNVDNNHITLLRSGPIAPAIHASVALPPIFAPVFLYNQTLIDGGVVAPVPVQVAKLFKPKMIIAVDISTAPSRAPLGNAFALVYRSLDIAFYELSRIQSTRADITIQPDLTGYGTFDDTCNDHMYEKGREAALEMLPRIKAVLLSKGIK